MNDFDGAILESHSLVGNQGLSFDRSTLAICDRSTVIVPKFNHEIYICGRLMSGIFIKYPFDCNGPLTVSWFENLNDVVEIALASKAARAASAHGAIGNG